MNKFDLEKALKGEPVVLRSGIKAYIRYKETDFKLAHPLLGFAMEEDRLFELNWTENGKAFDSGRDTDVDVVGMWVKPLVFEHWDLLREDVKYLAKDSNGRWFGFEGEPTQGPYGDWSALGGFIGMEVLNQKLLPECNWKDSLIKRPEK